MNPVLRPPGLGLLLSLGLLFLCCRPGDSKTKTPDSPQNTGAARVKVIFDTDANNELDDQHALAYLLSNADVIDLLGVTVNATYNGGDIEGHRAEAERILTLYNRKGQVPLLNGANANLKQISPTGPSYDGKAGVDFLLKQTKQDSVVIIAVGKLTTIALALQADPSFADRTRVVWLGSNYPEPGEYNQDNDTTAVNAVLASDIPFEMVTVRYGKASGTDAVKVTQSEINAKMPGLGPRASEPITGRHGGQYLRFGDYAVSLFEHIDYHGDPPSRPLFDMVAVALLKDPRWGQVREHPAPVLIDNQWVERPDNPRKIRIWEHFDREGLLADFYNRMANPVLEEKP
ncbi:nucleoside hydrolase [Robiginitalea sediminis]|uniref:nucleoside hydrolase n=1 Tax=Robiginitalea sediminis TaxID=1982593 RepID=UPI000B4B71B4|nr:nucleoside hydrolase [Robiginitalea sediminis]